MLEYAGMQADTSQKRMSQEPLALALRLTTNSHWHTDTCTAVQHVKTLQQRMQSVSVPMPHRQLTHGLHVLREAISIPT